MPAITGDPSVLLAPPPPDGGWTPRLDRTVTVGRNCSVTVRSSRGGTLGTASSPQRSMPVGLLSGLSHPARLLRPRLPLQRSVQQSLVQPPRQVAGGKLPKRPREGRLAWCPARRLPATQTPQRRVGLQPLHQPPRRGTLSTAFARKARAIAARSFSGRPRQPLLLGSDSSTGTRSSTRRACGGWWKATWRAGG